jgi:ubiquinone/menaquinone biosynthesis C-methylase UbiE
MITKIRIPETNESIDQPDDVESYMMVTEKRMMLRYRGILRRLANNKFEKILDVGCGYGLLCREMSMIFQDSDITGLDLSKSMIEKAEMAIKKENLDDRIRFVCDNAERTNLVSNQFDFIMSSFSLHHWNSPKDVLHEIYRLLKFGGHFLIVDLNRNMPDLMIFLIKIINKFTVPEKIQIWQMESPHGFIASVKASYTKDEIEKMMNGIPFKKIKVDDKKSILVISGQK